MNDDLITPCSSFPVSPPSSQFSPIELEHHHHQIIEFVSCEVPEQWLLSDVVVPAKSVDAGGPWSPGYLLCPDSDFSELPQATASLPASTMSTSPPRAKRRGRKPGPRRASTNVNHVEAERQRRDKLNHRFCELRAAVPTVSRMDKASLLADAVSYITELRACNTRLQNEIKQAAAASWDRSAASQFCGGNAFKHNLAGKEALEVRMMGREGAAVRVTTAAGSASHATARLMAAVGSLELQVDHLVVIRRQDETVQDVVVDLPAALERVDSAVLRSALLQRLHGSA